ncbi:uncharacterized protein [Physcomitrium patens]|uniref:uncharacterized protein isoform X2 n=2 Tax=Physcomitrium patens TaxID=3218 RepID=UPI003CCCBD9E
MPLLPNPNPPSPLANPNPALPLHCRALLLLHSSRDSRHSFSSPCLQSNERIAAISTPTSLALQPAPSLASRSSACLPPRFPLPPLHVRYPIRVPSTPASTAPSGDTFFSGEYGICFGVDQEIYFGVEV